MPQTDHASGTLWLAAPDTATLDTLARRGESFAFWPVGNRPLIEHWFAEAVRLNLAEIRVVHAGTSAALDAAVAGAGYWSRPIHVERHAPPGVKPIRVDHLPGQRDPGPPTTPRALLQRWLDLNLSWLAAPRDAALSIEVRHENGAWIHPRARIDPRALIEGPCWIGDGVRISAGARVGPHAVIGAGCVIDSGSDVRRSVILPDTYLGAALTLDGRLADGPVLFDPDRATRVDTADPLLLARARRDPLIGSLFSRLRSLFGSKAS